VQFGVIQLLFSTGTQDTLSPYMIREREEKNNTFALMGEYSVVEWEEDVNPLPEIIYLLSLFTFFPSCPIPCCCIGNISD
jgi:hypothetical protein